MNRVMFVCSTNSISSQIAEGFAKHLGVGIIQVMSAGLDASEIHPAAIATMDEIGVDISRQIPKPLSNFNPQDFDIVIALAGCGVNLPAPWLMRDVFEEWELEDPIRHPEILPKVRDEIRERVIYLIESLQTS